MNLSDLDHLTSAPDAIRAIRPVSGTVSAREAADILGLDERTIRRAIARGELAATRHGRAFQITSDALDQYGARHGAIPQPRGPAVTSARLLEADRPPTLVTIPKRSQARLAPLPTPLTRLIGREREVAAIVDVLQHGDVRLVTLTGPGGVGKTRLALAAAAAATFTDGVAFVELAPVRDPAHVLAAVAGAVGMQDLGQRTLRESLISALRGRELLLVLDNFEHVLSAAPHAAHLLSACPRLRVLASSRAPLGISGEQLWPVPPLPLSFEGDPTLDFAPAVALFVERAQAMAPDFRLSAANAATVVQICRHLDGLPLAIELAAVRIRILQPTEMLDRLDRRWALLTGGPRDLPPRLRTLADAIAWSYNLLLPDEQRLFRRLSVFAGGCTIEAVEAIASPDIPDPLAALQALVDHSLVRRDEDEAGRSRFGMLETIREYALHRLAAAGEEGPARDAHATYCLNVAERYAPDFFRDDDVVERAAAIAAEHANLLAALAHLAASEARGAQVRLAALLGPFWFHRAVHSIGRSCLERAVALPTERPADEAVALANLARLITFQGDVAAATETLARAQACATASGDPLALAFVATCQAILRMFEGDYAASQARAAEAEAIAISVDAPLAAAFACFVRARAIHYAGDLERAEMLFQEILVNPQPPRFAAALYRHSLAMLARTHGRHAHALTLDAAAIAVFFETGELQSAASCLEDIAEALAGLGRAGAAARLFGAAAAFRVKIGVPRMPPDVADYERAVASVRAALSPEAFNAAWDAGDALAVGPAVEEAQQEATLTLSAGERTSLSPAGLTPRERDVLRLLVAGLADKEIAAALAISRATVSRHVGTILAKLSAPSRSAAAAIAVRDRLT